LLPNLVLMMSLLVPVLMNIVARRASQGRVRLHPDHDHATVLASRYLVLSLLVCLGVPVVLHALVLGASWGPAGALAAASVLSIAALSRPGSGRDADMETWVHLFFGGLTSIMAVSAGVLLARIAGMTMGWLHDPIGPGLGMVVLGNTLVQTVAYAFFCVPFLRSGPVGQLPADPQLDPWMHAERSTFRLATDEVTDSGAA